MKSLRRRNGATTRPDTSLPLALVGFSKGAVVLNQLVTELAWEATPATLGLSLSTPTPNRSKRCDSRTHGDGDPAQLMNNRKRSRVSLDDCGGGGGRLASSEGVLTNPPSPAVSWEGGRVGEEQDGGGEGGVECNESSPGPQDGSGSRSHQVRPRTRKCVGSRQPSRPPDGRLLIATFEGSIPSVMAPFRFLSSRHSRGLWCSQVWYIFCFVYSDGDALVGKISVAVRGVGFGHRSCFVVRGVGVYLLSRRTDRTAVCVPVQL